jgi:hypothetical protein
MDALDGNAIAGDLFQYFGAEVTTARGSCAHCGTTAQVAELRVYPRAPGTVVRCPTCANVVMVLITIGETLTIHHKDFQMPGLQG